MNRYFEEYQDWLYDYHLVFTEPILAKFHHFFKLLLQWNAFINLTAVKSEEAVFFKHFVDSLMVLTLLPRPYEKSVLRVIDVGSGAGFPGIPLAISDDRLKVTLLESKKKKCEFLFSVKTELKLDVEIVPIDLQAYRPEQGFDVALSRATFEPLKWLKAGNRLICPQGRVIVMLGKKAEPLLEKTASKLGLFSDQDLEFELPQQYGHRRLISYKKVPPS